jgi:hypothetical protein
LLISEISIPFIFSGISTFPKCVENVFMVLSIIHFLPSQKIVIFFIFYKHVHPPSIKIALPVKKEQVSEARKRYLAHSTASAFAISFPKPFFPPVIGADLPHSKISVKLSFFALLPVFL